LRHCQQADDITGFSDRQLLSCAPLLTLLDTAAAAAAAGKGISNPLEINILPSTKGLGSVSKKHQHHAGGTSNKSKKGRGGERSRRRKAIAARHAAKEAAGDRQAKMEAATGTEGLFAFINYNLGSGSEAADKLRDAGVYGSGSSSKQQTAGAAALASASAAAGGKAGSRQQQQQQRQQQQQPDRQGLVGSHDNLAEKKVSCCNSSQIRCCNASVFPVWFLAAVTFTAVTLNASCVRHRSLADRC
jgi:hypothetical protein